LPHRSKRPTLGSPIALILWAAALGVGLPGCGPKADDPGPVVTRQQPGDGSEVYVAAGRDGRAVARPAGEADPAGAGDGDAYTVDAMVGHINGKPVYASRVFREVGEQTLETLGRSKPVREFRADLAELFSAKLGEMVSTSLVLAEAESQLSERERQGLQAMLARHREDLISRHGGALALAEDYLQRERGLTLDEAVEQHRQRVLISRYMQSKLMPRVHVGRREVERYYQEHHARFNPPEKLTLRMIRVEDEAAAAEVEAALAAGEPFAEVARRYSKYRPDEGGLMNQFTTTDRKQFNELVWPALNRRVRLLEEGLYTPRTAIDGGWAWVYLEEVERKPGQPLREVFLEIEEQLRRQEFVRLERRYMREMRQRGNFTPLDQMLAALIEVAVNRYGIAE
jgi:hypothetical protein